MFEFILKSLVIFIEIRAWFETLISSETLMENYLRQRFKQKLPFDLIDVYEKELRDLICDHVNLENHFSRSLLE